MWKYTGNQRPDFAESTGPGQESVWDYPRPPALQRCTARVEVHSASALVASTTKALRVLETASPPTWYLPPDDIQWHALQTVPGTSFCEWKGAARYWALADASSAEPVGWSYPQPTAAFAELVDYVAFYPGRVSCTVNGELVRPQPGEFYGGWVTDNITGPFKGEPGTGHW